MYSTLTTLINRLDSSAISRAKVIKWGCPVPSFGDLSNSRVATLGLNPSNREFVDESGKELQGKFRRFHTLRSLGLKSWSDIDARHLHKILESCRAYFLGNPYDQWFRRLDHVISGTNASYYNAMFGACHLDLIPYATACKWFDLTVRQRLSLLAIAGDTLGLLLRDTSVRVLILNGQSVVDHFQGIAGISLEKQEMPKWSLRRQGKPNVRGIAYTGMVDRLSGIELGNSILVLGFNHNLQSSFGVTTEVIQSIRSWITQASSEVM
jgi:hypothetical protein